MKIDHDYDKLIIIKNSNITEILRYQEYLIILIDYILRPSFYPVSARWAKNHPDLHYINEETTTFTPLFRKTIYEQLGT